jgi:hypothetical protein
LNEAGKGGARQLAVLRLLGLFDRPAAAGCMAALRSKPAITDLTEPLVGLYEEDWSITLSSLSDCGLVSLQIEQSATGNQQLAIDAHPLIREYFAKKLREKKIDSWWGAHQRLYEHLCHTTNEGDQATLEDLQPLYQAVAHGCQAGLPQNAFDEVYKRRLLRGNNHYSWQKLAAFASDLGAVACFFERPWTRFLPALTAETQAFLLAQAALYLRALGRLTEAFGPMQVALEMEQRAAEDAKQEEIRSFYLTQAAIVAGNLSELRIILGDVAGALRNGEQSVTYADRSENPFQKRQKRAKLAHALHQAGRRTEAGTRFHEAEGMQVEEQPSYPILYSLQGFLFCDFLMTDAESGVWRTSLGLEARRDSELDGARASSRAASERAVQTLKWIEWQPQVAMLDVALDTLTIARSALYTAMLKSAGSKSRLPSLECDTAVAALRRAGAQYWIPAGLLTRAWLRFLEEDTDGERSDLDEAWEIAERGPMRLFMADIHLYRARLFHGVKAYPWKSPQEDLVEARRLIEQCGYWRRKEELEDAEEAATNW